FRDLLPALAERGHGAAMQQWIDGLPSVTLKVRLLLILGGNEEAPGAARPGLRPEARAVARRPSGPNRRLREEGRGGGGRPRPGPRPALSRGGRPRRRSWRRPASSPRR